VLGPVTAWIDGVEVDLRGPQHRAVLARLVLARGRTVPVQTLVDDLWTAPPEGAVGAVRTFVAALRRALEPDRPPRSPARWLVTVGSGYALRTPPGGLDVEEFSHTDDPERSLALWRGPAYDGVGDHPWALAERRRLADERLHVAELLAERRTRDGDPERAVADLTEILDEFPYRENSWRLLAVALHTAGRRGEALAVLRSARDRLVDDLGLDAGELLQRTEIELLQDRGSTRWPAAVDALNHLAVSGGDGLREARDRRSATLDAARSLDPRTAARIVGGFQVPALWSRSDDPTQAAHVVAQAEELLTAELPDLSRARLLATIGIETRGLPGARGRQAAAEAVRLARGLQNPQALVAALNAAYLASFSRLGGTAERRAIGTELVEVSARHEMVPYEILGHLVLVQTYCAVGDLVTARRHVEAAEELGGREGTPLVSWFAAGFSVLRQSLSGVGFDVLRKGQLSLERGLADGAMPGLQEGFHELTLAATCVQHGLPVPGECGVDGPFRPWLEPLVRGGSADLRRVPDPPPGHLEDLLWCLLGLAAARFDDVDSGRRVLAALGPVEHEVAGASSGFVTLGPVATFTVPLRDQGSETPRSRNGAGA